MPAVLAGIDVAAECRRAAVLDRRHDLELGQAEMTGLDGTIAGAFSSEDIGDLDRGAQAASAAGMALLSEFGPVVLMDLRPTPGPSTLRSPECIRRPGVDWRAKVDLFEQLRREHEFGIGTIAGVAAKFGVHRRVVREALVNAPCRRSTLYPNAPKPKLGAFVGVH